MKKLFLVFVLAVSVLACGGTTPRKLNLYPSPTVLPTQTERVVQITTTPVYTYTPLLTYTPYVKVVTETPQPGYLCVSADEAVYLRPSADLTGYPIAPLPNGTRLTDLGGRKNDFAFVSNGEQQGWVNLDFIQICK